jgi:2-oxoisovalerate dehydrogenase E1 component alpha subunit
MNFAGIHRVPAIFVCENNEYAISVPQAKQMAVRDVASRAEGYGMPGVVVDGSDVLACYAAMREAHERARAGDGPTLIECKTYRFLPHTSDDDDKTYRSKAEVAEHRHRDPIDRFTAYLIDHGMIDHDGVQAVHDDLRREVDAAIDEAWEAPDPAPESATRHVFHEEEP